ncbi:high mobility group box domain-containing protein [Mycotypha africana]|uniref:high mobility group box domain-containing protein n=1 Tax=Mycotypha africana TaxID=64632 RepID=UPI002300643A|nr:high mobility group box domain-containing protein [Mycotypha africana]KAI8982262.1 high mobility group box domain-containing protein [Mycotypha africana]
MTFVGPLAIQARQLSTKNLNPKKFTSILSQVPPRPVSAWQIYQREHINQFKRPDGKIDIIASVKGLSSKWKALSDSEKQVYINKYEQESNAHFNGIETAINNATPEQIRKENLLRKKHNLGLLKDPREPKRPRNAFFLYARSLREARDPEIVHLPIVKQATVTAKKFKALSDMERKPFIEQAEAEKQRYQAAMKKYLAEARALD